MFSLQRLFGKPDKFFSLLQDGALQACRCAEELKLVLNGPDSLHALQTLQLCRQQNKKCLDEASALVVRTFITALDREDIEAIAAALYKIPKPIEKFAERYLANRERVMGFSFDSLSALLELSTKKVQEMLTLLTTGINIEKVRALNTELQAAEVEADVINNRLIQELFSTNVDAIRVILLRDLYDLLERSIDRCRDAGSIISHVCLKYS